MEDTTTASSSGIPVDHLDYGYIGKVSNISELENILTVLRSKSEGYYPDLIEFTEKRLRSLNPDSKLLIEDQKVKRAKELSKEQLNEIRSDMKQWEEDITAKDRHLSSSTTTDSHDDETHPLPPIRTSVNINPQQSKGNNPKRTKDTNPERIKSSDYTAWDKFDADKESPSPVTGDKKADGSAGDKTLSEKLSAKELSLSEHEKEQQANKEREKGNEAFRAGDYKEALVYYSRSVGFYSSAAAHNNKALTLNKLGRYEEAISSCNDVLNIEPNNTKALIRRADAYFSLKKYCPAVADLEATLKLEPTNKRASELMKKIPKGVGGAKGGASGEMGGAKGGASGKKGKRITIEEVDETGKEEGREAEPVAKTTNQTVPTSKGETDSKPHPPAKSSPPPLPPLVQKRKEEGNSFFKRGQYGDAVECYTKCVKLLEKESGDHSQSLATILSNRAACHLKNGDCRGCINDATRSIELVPVNLKSFVRRAQAYETMEKYKQAYCDYQVALRIDSRVDKARESSSRISLILRDAHGNNWRDFLPASTDIERVNAGLVAATELAPPLPQVTTPPDARKPENGGLGGDSSSSQSLPPNVKTSTTSTDTRPVSTDTKAASTDTGPASTAARAKAGAGGNGDKSKKFEESKSRGNELVKQTKYKEATDCYTFCISLCPHEVAPYTNRALCYLKLNQFSLAEDDCSKALVLDSTNVKALYRRALARKSLNKLNESLKDLRTLTSQDPDNAPAKKEEKIVHDLYLKELRQLQETASAGTERQSSKKPPGKKPKSAAPSVPPPVAKQPAGKPKRKKVMVEEVGKESEARGVEPVAIDVPETKGDVVREKMSNIKQEKLSLSQYIQLWNTSLTSSASAYQYAVLLMKIPPSLLPQVISSKLEGHTLSGIIAAVEQFIMKEGFYKIAYDVLVSLTKVSRFAMILMFLSEQDKQCLRRIFSSLEGTGSYNYEQINKLRHSYSLL